MKNYRLSLYCLASILTLFSSCATNPPRDPSSVNQTKLAQPETDPLISKDLRPELSNYDGKITLLEKGTATTDKHCVITRISLEGKDPVTGEKEIVSLFSYVPLVPKGYVNKVLIDPPTGGITPLDRGLAQSLCAQGAEVAVIETWSGYEEVGKIDFGSHDRASIRAIFAGRYAIEYLNAPVVIVGASVGAIYSSMIAGQDSRVKAGVLTVGGAPMVDVLTLTDQKIPATLREMRMKEFHIADYTAYKTLLEKNVRISASDFANPSRAQDFLFFIALKDTTVPTATQINLWKAWGEPERIDFKKNHTNTIIASSILRKNKIVNFILAHAAK